MSRSIALSLIAAAAIVFASPALAQVAPTAAPENVETQPKTEFATPQSTVDMLRLALVKSDAAAFKECFYTEGDSAKAFIDAFSDMTIAMRSMTQLAAQKFKDDADAAKFAKTAAQFADSMECSKIEIDGDKAKGTTQKDAKKFVYFKKVEGKWKFDAVPTLPINDTTKILAKDMPVKTKVFNQARSELAAGKFSSFQAMRDRLAELFAAETKPEK